MTMTTEVAIRLPNGHETTPQTMLDVAVTALLTAAGRTPRPGSVLVDDVHLTSVSWGERHYLSTKCDQGLPSWTFVYFNGDGQFADTDVTYGQAEPWLYGDDEPDQDDEPDRDRIFVPACTYVVKFDGSHSQMKLHANAIHRLQQWLDDRGGSLLWSMPPESEWHEFADRQAWARQLRGAPAWAAR